MEHLLAKILLITNVTELIAKKYSISLAEARDKLYSSDIIGFIDDDETGLYGESPLYLFCNHGNILSILSKSEKANSEFIISTSLTGSTSHSTCTTSLSLK